MVPHVAARGSSFKGAGLYYLHDKSARTSERVAWVQTHNVPTKAPDKALKWMAYTAINADRIKAEYGGSKAGAKSKGKPVYSYSLSWHEGDQPDHKEMQGAVMETLERLGLKEHEAVMVAHRDTDHPHVHVVCNLVHPKTGRTKSMSNDHLKLSKWAQEHDLRHGRDHCPERIRNNQERSRRDLNQEFNVQQQKEAPNNQTKRKYVKHRKKEDPRSQIIQELYNQSDSGKAFKAALQEQGYTLAQGHKGRMVLVNDQGQVYALARQLKGQRARDIKARLKDVDFKSLPVAKELAEDRQHFDRDKYETDWQKGIVDAAIEARQKEPSQQSKKEKEGPESAEKKEPYNGTHSWQKSFTVGEKSQIHLEFNREQKEAAEKKKQKGKLEQEATSLSYDDRHLRALDKLGAWEKSADKKRYELESQLRKTHAFKQMMKEKARLEKELKQADNRFDRLIGKYRSVEEELSGLTKTMEHSEMRMKEARDNLEKELAKTKPPEFKHSTPNKEQELEYQLEPKLTKTHNQDLEEGYTLDR